MKASYKILLIVAVAAIFLYCVFLAVSSRKQVVPSSQSNNTLSIPAQGGGTLKVQDVTKNPAQVLGDTDVVEQNSNYTINYFTKDQSFLITILAQPIQANRDAAEQELLNELGISAADACKITVVLTVPAFVDETHAGQDYGLSFCPNGKAF